MKTRSKFRAKDWGKIIDDLFYRDDNLFTQRVYDKLLEYLIGCIQEYQNRSMSYVHFPTLYNDAIHHKWSTLMRSINPACVEVMKVIILRYLGSGSINQITLKERGILFALIVHISIIDSQRELSSLLPMIGNEDIVRLSKELKLILGKEDGTHITPIDDVDQVIYIGTESYRGAVLREVSYQIGFPMHHMGAQEFNLIHRVIQQAFLHTAHALSRSAMNYTPDFKEDFVDTARQLRKNIKLASNNNMLRFDPPATLGYPEFQYVRDITNHFLEMTASDE